MYNVNSLKIPIFRTFDRLMYKMYYEFTVIFPRRGRRGRDRMVVGFMTTYAISAYHH
jgi:hypothetical protein